MTKAYIGLGANLGNPPRQILLAIRHVQKIPGVRVAALSPFYHSAPQGCPGRQPDYCNAAAELRAILPPRRLHRQLQKAERAVRLLCGGRPRRTSAPRFIDIDYLFHGGASVRSRHLTLPHPRLLRRAFVLRPLADITGGSFDGLKWQQQCIGAMQKLNVSFPRRRESISNSSFPRRRESISNSSFPRKRESISNSSFPRKRESISNSSFPRKRESTPNSSFPRRRESTATQAAHNAAPVILTLESGGDSFSAALTTAGGDIVQMTAAKKPKGNSESALPLISALLRKCKTTLAQCDAFAFAAGPGKFSGLRLSCALCQSFGYAHNKPVVQVPTLAALAECNYPAAQQGKKGEKGEKEKKQKTTTTLPAHRGHYYRAECFIDNSGLQKDGAGLQKDGADLQKSGADLQKDGAILRQESRHSCAGRNPFGTLRQNSKDAQPRHSRAGGNPFGILRRDGGDLQPATDNRQPTTGGSLWRTKNTAVIRAETNPAPMPTMPHPDAAATARLAVQMYAKGELTSPMRCAPLYIRQKIAQTIKERKHPQRQI